MRYQLLLGVTPVVLFVFILIFRKSLNKYIAAYGKRLLVPLAAVVLGGPKALLMVLPFYSIYFFLREYKAAQAIADIATSKISSAAQGYVEIIGKGVSAEAAISPVSGQRCLWYEYQHYRTKGWLSRLMLGLDRGDWELLASGKLEDIFTIGDGSDHCLVNPRGAQVSELEYEEWYEGNNFYKEARLLPGRDLYVLGNFITQSASQQRTEFSRQVGALIAEWKQDQKRFLERFDLDNDGQVSEQELELVRAAATREIRKQLGELKPQTTISKPSDNRPFIISHHAHHKLIRRHKLHSYFYVALLLVSSAMLANMLSTQQGNKHLADEDGYPKGWAALVLDPYRNSCSDLSGTYATVSNAGNIKLADTFVGNRLLKPAFEVSKHALFRDWDTLTISQYQQSYGATMVKLVAERSPQTMQALETELRAKDPEQYARYQAMSNPATRQKSRYYIDEEQTTFFEPKNMSNDDFENAIDGQFFWHSHRFILDKNRAEYSCEGGWVTSYIKSGDPVSPWLKIAVTKDQAGNLIARKFYTQPNVIAGVIFDDTIVVLDWTRWPATLPAWSSNQR